MASYFSYFPSVYVGEGVTDKENFKYRLVKNIFRRVKAREDLDQYVTLFESYSVKPDETPASIANELYGDPFLDWAVLLINNITDLYEQWPKNQTDLQEYVSEKYNDADGVHHYETNEILYNGVVYYKEGIEVTESFRVTMPDGTVLSEEESIYPVSNYEYEYYKNEQKRLITLAQPAMIDLMQTEMRDLLAYEDHIEVDESGYKKTPVSLSSKFINNVGSITGSATQSEAIGAVTSFDYGPTIAGVATSTTTTAVTTTTISSSSSSSGSSSSSSSSSSSGSSGSSGGSGY